MRKEEGSLVHGVLSSSSVVGGGWAAAGRWEKRELVRPSKEKVGCYQNKA